MTEQQDHRIHVDYNLKELERLMEEIAQFGARHGWSDTRIGAEYGDRAVIHRVRRGLEDGRVRVPRGTIASLRQFMARTDIGS